VQTLAAAFDRDITWTLYAHVVHALVATLAIGAAVELDHWAVRVGAGGLVLLVVLTSLAVAMRRRALRRFRTEALAPGGVVAVAHEAGVLTLWLESGRVVGLRSKDVEIRGAIRAVTPDDREALRRWCEVRAEIGEIERELSTSSLIGELAREHFGTWARAWRELDPLSPRHAALAPLLRELLVQAIAARDYERTVGARAMVDGRDDVRDMPFIGAVATLQGRLAAALEDAVTASAR
jgi:hypothetical protein